MQKRFLPITLLISVVVACSPHHTPTDFAKNSATCAQIEQKLNRKAGQSLNPSTNPVTAAHHAHLLKMYNHSGCHANSDNRYVYPDQSLEINASINNQPAKSFKNKE